MSIFRQFFRCLVKQTEFKQSLCQEVNGSNGFFRCFDDKQVKLVFEEILENGFDYFKYMINYELQIIRECLFF